MLQWDTPQKVMREIEDAEKYRDRHMHGPRLLREWFTGRKYKSGYGEKNPEAAVHSYMAMLLPRLTHDNPRARVSTPRQAEFGQYARGMQEALNQWARLTNVRATVERCAMDIGLGWGIIRVTQEPQQTRPWDSDGPWLPRIYRVSPDHWFCDPVCDSYEEARFAGHRWFIDRDDLLARAKVEKGWSEEKINALTETTDRGEQRRDRPTLNRKQVAVYEVWVPEIHDALFEEEDKAAGEVRINGTIFTVGMYQSGNGSARKEFVRRPMPYYGPREGPYVLIGAYVVPEDPYPLSPLVACMDQIEMANVTAIAQQEAIKKYKRLLLTRNATDIEKLLKPGVEVIPGEPQTTGTIEIGGMTTQHIAAAEATFQRLDRALGMNDARRGNIDTTATATAVATAQSESNARVAHVQRAVVDGLSRAYRAVAWYMHYDERIKIPVPSSGAVGGVFAGGQELGRFDELGIEIDAYSMERVTEALATKRALDAGNLVIQIAQAQAAMPWLKGSDLLKFIGDAQNVPQLGEMIDFSRISGSAPGQQMLGQGGR